MNFDFDDTQYALRDLARDLFARESPPSRVRGLWEGKPFDRGVWKTMAQAGITGITVPEEFGGAGGNDIDLALVFEEAGRAALPEPLFETTGFAAPVIAEYGSDEMRERWLPAIASGDAIVTFESPFDGNVAWGTEADLLLLASDGVIHAVPKDRFRATPIPTIDPARPLATVKCELGPETALRELVQVRPERTAFGVACMLNDIAMHLLDVTVEYVKDREQFGRPIGSFQAVKHKLADMYTALASSRPAAWYAAHAIATGAPDAFEAGVIAKIAAGQTEALCNTEALQCHGGIGFTWEHDLHLWLKRGIALRNTLGGAALHRSAVAKTLLAT